MGALERQTMGAFGMKEHLHTQGLSVGYGKRKVLENVDLRILPGELIALIGVNGSGKSTLLRTLAGLQDPLAGNISWGDVPLKQLSARQRARRMALVLTAQPSAALLDVRTLVSLGRQPWTGYLGRLSGADRSMVEQAMDHTGIVHFEGRTLDTLSDGERKKVMIARALAQDTPLLLLDEPTASLDLVNRVLVMRLLHRIAHELGRAVLFSTHDLRAALDLADRIVLVREGGVWCGTPAVALSTGVLADAFQVQGLLFDPVTGSLR